MNNSFEHMQKLAFGKVVTETKKEVLTESALKDKIRELVHSSLGEAKKKKKGEDVAPQEDVDLEMSATEEMPEDTMAPEPMDGADIDPTVKSIQDSLQKAFANAKTLGDEKLIAQIGNTITMLVRTQVLGGQQVNEDKLTIPQLAKLKPGAKVKYLGKSKEGFETDKTYEVSRVEVNGVGTSIVTIKNDSGKKMRTSNLQENLNEEYESADFTRGYDAGYKEGYRDCKYDAESKMF